jgi:pilus assembly protein CpaB
MNKRLLTILLLAFIIAGACAFLVYRIMGNRIVASRPTPTTRVVAAAQDIKLGTVLAAGDLTTIEVSGGAPKGTFLEKDKGTLIGRGVVSDLYSGEPILETRLAPAGSGGGLAATIPKGMRACAVRVDEVVGVAGFVTPGQRVDVLASGTPPNASQTSQIAQQGTQIRTILQNIEVLSAGVNIQKDAEGKPQQVQVVNLLVTPDQAEMLSLASSNNGVKIQLVLRNPLDTKTDPIQGSAMLNIFDQNAAPVKNTPQQTGVVHAVKSKPRPKPFSVVIFNGSKRSEEKFPALEDNKQ